MIRQGYGQFFDHPTGINRLMLEVGEMRDFPFRADLCQNESTGEVSWDLYILSHGIIHKVNIRYDPFHPDYEMEAYVEYPWLERSRMGIHWHGDNKPCYTTTWSRRWTALMVATQLTFWLDDYYRGNYGYESAFRGLFR